MATYTAIEEVDEEEPELIYAAAANLMDQGFGYFDYERY